MAPQQYDTFTMIILFQLSAVIAAQDFNLAPTPPLNLNTRQTSVTDLIDPVTMPYCEASSCWHYGDYPPPAICPLVTGPCANDSDSSINDGDKCGPSQYHRDCYCSLKTGLYCAWSCSWTTWWETEDWFAAECPNSAAITMDFSGLPSCARDCINDATFGYGCLTESSNCFCSNGDLFGCHDNCHSAGEWQQIENWLKDTCNISSATATEALKSGTFTLTMVTSAPLLIGATNATRFSPARPARRKHLSWDEDFIIAILAFTGLAGFGLWVQGCIARGKFKET
ncbi:hypothetical protein EG329_013792 [Mollisiaceae sp. DMI_Dod_QoI]|nr:hypothetical protein EG329_013792 [Helotiales sp. DMI_Dod_QoI]